MALIDLVMPKMGESIMEATILRWHKKVGDFVKMDETLLDIATDKVDSEVPSTSEGYLKEILYKENDVVPVGYVLARIETEVLVEAAVPQPTFAAPVEQQQPIYEAAHISEPVYVPTFNDTPAPPPPLAQEFIPFVPQQSVNAGGVNNRFFSPLVLNIANSEGLSLSELERIPGTGADGRVSKKDVLQYIADKRAGRYPATASTSFAPQQFITKPQEVYNPVSIPVETEQIVNNLSIPVEDVANEVVHHKLDVIESLPIAAAVGGAFAASQFDTTAQDEIAAPAFDIAPVETITQSIEQPVVEDTPAMHIEEMQAASMAAAETVAFQQEEQQVVVTETPTIVNEPLPIIEQTIAPTYKNAEIIEMDRMRKLIAKHMVNSKQTSPHVTSFTECDVTNMVTWRNKIKDEFEKREGMKITYTPMFIECILKVMKNYPIINSSVVGDKIIMKKDFNIGMATALPTGNLIVPVIKNANEMNFISLTRSVNTLAASARDGKLKADDVTEGTFTFTNVGTFGSLMGTPIINQPQVAIIAVGAIKKRPVVVETDKGDFIGIRHMMYLSLSYDHRIIDGSIGASFLSDVAKEMEAWDVNRQLKYVVKEWYVE
jgi:2-oxoglutarate dehydrogenase E2 component (dihydrolipoamide succinyltransferase)